MTAGHVGGAGPADPPNPYWDEVKAWVGTDPFGDGLVLGSYDNASGLSPIEAFGTRREMVQRFSWTVTDPDTVAFVRKHVGDAVIDPMAGSGYWAYLLAAAGVDVVASDLHPPDQADNQWHPSRVTHHPIVAADAVEAVRLHGRGRTLLLAWPPYARSVGADVLETYPGERVVYLGEVGDACGDDHMVDLINQRWQVVATHIPVQWFGLHDVALALKRLPA